MYSLCNIITQNCNGTNKIILIVSRSQYEKNNIITTEINGKGIIKHIPVTNIEFNNFSAIEQQQLLSISKILVKLHKIDFSGFPFIGWDVCLTHNGPYLYEINLISEVRYSKEYINYYLNQLNKLYNS